MQITKPNNNIILEAALIAAKAALQEAKKLKAKMVVAISDRSGNVVTLLRDDGAFLASITIAKNKAYTAAVFGVSTDDLCNALSANPILKDGIGAQEGIILFGGGYPLIENGEVIGAIGVSGGSEDEDRQCAMAGLKAILN